MFILSSKLKKLKGVLRNLNLKDYSEIGKRVVAAKEDLDLIQDQFFKFLHDPELCANEKVALNNFVELRMAEESFLKQKSRVMWLALGDHNSKFFHHKLCSHRARNNILSLTDSSGNLLIDSGAIKDEILGYYTGLLGTAFGGKVNPVPTLNQAIHAKVPSHLKD
ncbi:hypothetical protein RHMOL_Rhmol05G0146600 [Rhododendron molle]|uniref:Uncharacterized protein n=1 Tax=Rhododendron molle TaxID=49168 RepID=A0ACC0NNW4_RHOML|nr:hypothetical protein RHMOL_Rhmol05G0146600 [Rhododendron molle]